MDRCANCKIVIGDLETPYLWREKVVCAACYARLSGTAPPAATQSASSGGTPAASLTDDDIDSLLGSSVPPVHVQPLDYANAARREPTPPLRHGAVPCPVCGSTAPPIKKAKGSCLVVLLLALFFVLPALIYMIFYQGYVLVCPQCGTKRGDVA